MTTFGLDYAWSHPSVSAMKKAGVKFACRYLSHDGGKNLTRTEATALTNAGIACVVVWESTANRARSGRTGGIADAKAANTQAKAAGMPSTRPIYFAVDFDATPGDQAKINAYLDGAASVIGRDRVGIYAGYYPLKRAMDAGHAKWGWQTYAWSGGQWYSGAHIQQYSNGHTVGGASCDYNRATKSDFGQWMVGKTPEVDDMPNPQDLWHYEIPKTSDFPDAWMAETHLRHATVQLGKILAGQAALAQKAGVEVDENAIVKGILASLSPAAIADAVTQAMPADLAQQVVDELKSRL